MYEETKSSIDWKGIFLKVIIAFLIVLIAVKGYTTLKGNNDKQVVKTTTETTAESKSSSTFTANIEKLRDAGEKYYTTNKDKLPTTEGNTTMVTLNELINSGIISTLSDEDGKTCDGESSYVTAVKEGEKTKIKANLVCGSASSYSLVYMGENDAETKEETTTTTTNTGSTTKSSSSKKTTTTCSTSTCGTGVTVNTNVSQNVTINSDKKTSGNTSSNTSNNNTNNVVNRYYTVSFDSNGGSREYASQNVIKNGTAYNPGSTTRSGYTFIGWYLNGYKYDFSTPVTSNITLIAKFTKNYEDDADDYYYDYDSDELITTTTTTTVYSLGWDKYGTDEIEINHTLRVPEIIEERDTVKVKIKDITVSSALTTSSQLSSYKTKFNDTFIYQRNGWEYKNPLTSNLAKINKSYVEFYPETTRYVDIDDALDEGFNVTWYADRVTSQCKNTFNVTGPNGDVSYNNCGYGIVYKVTWQYQYYR